MATVKLKMADALTKRIVLVSELIEIDCERMRQYQVP